MMKFIGVAMVLIALGANCVSAQDATTVYRTVDESGAVSFSDAPPTNQTDADVLTINTPAPQADTDSRQRLEEMRETTDRMAADRRAREKHRAELRELTSAQVAEQQGNSAQPEYDQTEYFGGYYPHSGYPYYPLRPRPRPPYPHPRPPLVHPQIDTEAWSQRHNSQLMRPILPRGR